MKVLVVGSGGREHALVWKIAQSPRVETVFCAPGNPGTAQDGQNVDIAGEDLEGIVAFAKTERIDLTVVGPEDPLCRGLVDRLEAAGLRAFGPSAAAARIEGDKAFAKRLMQKYVIPTGEARIFDSFPDAKRYIASRDESIVVKAAGLAKGKGVVVCDDPAEAILAAEKIMVDRIHGQAGDRLIVEERLVGQEASILAFVDGRNIYLMESAQDHKPVGDGDTGPNTGGMGAYSPAPVVTDQVLTQITSQILVPTVDAMVRQGHPYKGVLYAGLMITDQGPKVLEFNARFGDPETQPILMRMQSDIVDCFEAVIDARLDRIEIEWDARPAVCVVMASGGYPGSYEKGKPISGIEQADALKDVKVFHAGTARKNGQVVNSGGRVLGVTALGRDIRHAQARAYEAVRMIHWDGAHYRKDIGDKALR